MRFPLTQRGGNFPRRSLYFSACVGIMAGRKRLLYPDFGVIEHETRPFRPYPPSARAAAVRGSAPAATAAATCILPRGSRPSGSSRTASRPCRRSARPRRSSATAAIIRTSSPAAGEEGFVDYEREAGVRDTAYEVPRARADGIAVICVFTGEEADVPAARLVYGQDFARIQSLELLADTVGRLIRNQLRNL